MHEGIVETYIRTKAEAQLRLRAQRMAGIADAAALRARQADVRAVTAEILGALPERVSLSLQLIDRLPREGYTVEVVTFLSRADILATANVYVPAGPASKRPAALLLSNHNVEGKAAAEYQRMAQMLARRGIVTLVFDQLGQGERIQFFDVPMRRSWIGHTVAAEHTHLGNMLFLTGRHLGRSMTWEAIRALDVLAERSDVDGARVGVVGLDGGTAVLRFLACLDERIAAAVCVLGAEELDPLGGGCVDQNLFGALPRGVAPVDHLIALAPKPLLLTYPHRASEADPMAGHVEELRAAYTRAGGAGAFETCTLEPGAAVGRVLRVRAAEFLAKAFGLPNQDVRETQAPTEKAAVLQATETGQVGNSLGHADLFHRHLAVTGDLPPAAELPRDAESARKMQEELRRRMAARLQMPEPTGPVEGHVESHSTDWGLSVEKGRLIVDEGIYLPYAFYTPPDDDQGRRMRPVVLAVHDRGVAAISAIGPWMTRLAAAGYHILSIDVRGTGETRLQPERLDGDPYEKLLMGPESMWARRALNAGLNLFGMRVFDTLRALEYLRTRPDVQAEEVSLVGVGRGALWALYASALDPKVRRVALLRGLGTYKSLVAHRLHNHHFSMFLGGVLNDYDLPQVAASVAPRPLTLLNTVNERRERMPAEEVARAYAFTQLLYKRFDAPEALRVRTTDHAPATLDALSEALGLPAAE
ncbi:MAG: acetylxylan esterase [Planctomycetes bacterium]|nr:acetylxylan esterase [Planctomycetota bacterium]